MSNHMDSNDHDALVAEQGFVLDVLEALLEAMEERGISQADLARALGVSRASVSRVLNSTNLTTRTIFRYARAIGVDVRFEVGPPRSRYVPANTTTRFRPAADAYGQVTLRGAA